MPITRYYDIACDVCGRDFDPKLGGLQLGSLEVVKKRGWLILYGGNGKNPYAAICPRCWEQIADCYKQFSHRHAKAEA